MSLRRTSFRLLAVSLVMLGLASCAPKIKVFQDYSEPLRETVLQGEAREKVLLVPVRGVISDETRRGLLSARPGTVQELAAHLQKAARDPDIKAVVLTIDSPGGAVTASDVAHREIERFTKATGVPVVACLMGMAASGGYYVALSAERIVAHPTTVTGSVGTIFVQPRVDGLMDKIGVSVTAYTSGDKKDMGSPFRPATDEERALFREIIGDLNARFLDLATTRRDLSGERLTKVADGRVVTASTALALGLVDRVGYLDDALAEARDLAGLPDDARVVAYRRTVYADDTVHNPATALGPEAGLKLIELGAAESALSLKPGFYWLWLPTVD